MVYCAAVNCNNGSRKNHNTPQTKVAFFNFPKKQAVRKIWIAKVRRKHWTPSNSSKLCSNHFEESQFVQNLTVLRYIGWSVKKLELVSDAVPTIFNYMEESKRKASEPPRARNAFAKRRRQEVGLQNLIDLKTTRKY